MADQALVEKMGVLAGKGLSEEAIKQQLTQEGWSKEEVNGAYGVHFLSQLPVGASIVDRWDSERRKRRNERRTSLFRVVLYLFGVAATALGLLYFGSTSTPLRSVDMRGVIDTYMQAVVVSK